MIAIATKSGSSFLLGSVHTALGQAHAQRGNIDKAEAALRQGHAARLKAAGNAPCAFLAESGVLLAECDLARERLATAKELARAAVQAAKAAGAVEVRTPRDRLARHSPRVCSSKARRSCACRAR